MQNPPPYDESITAAVAVLFDPAGSVLLGKRASHLTHGDMWCNPGGGRHAGEVTIHTAIREVREEIGFDLAAGGLDINRLMGTFVHAIPRGGRHEGSLVEVFFFCYLPHELLPLTPSEDELTELSWFRFDRLPDDLHPGSAVQLAYLIGSIL